MKPYVKRFLDRFAGGKMKPFIELPQDMRDEIERLGEDEAEYQYWAHMESLNLARLMLSEKSQVKALFEEWFPVLQKFAYDRREATPIPTEDSLSDQNRAIRRILQPRIESEGWLSQDKYNVPIFSAPLAALQPVAERFSAFYENPIFLTSDEKEEWNRIYEMPWDAPSWNMHFFWSAELNPSADRVWVEDHMLPSDVWTPVWICSGASSGPMGFSSEALWAIDDKGNEQFITDLASSQT